MCKGFADFQNYVPFTFAASKVKFLGHLDSVLFKRPKKLFTRFTVMVTIEPLPLTPTGRAASSPPHRSIVNNSRAPWKSSPQWSEGPWSNHFEDSPSVNQWNRRFLPQSKRTPTPKSRISRAG